MKITEFIRLVASKKGDYEYKTNKESVSVSVEDGRIFIWVDKEGRSLQILVDERGIGSRTVRSLEEAIRHINRFLKNN